MNDETPVYTVTQAAVLAGMHPQTLRQYDRLGLVVPSRTAGRGRRYSQRDITDLLEVQRLAQDGCNNLVGIKRILDLERQVARLKRRVAQLQGERHEQEMAEDRVFTVSAEAGEVVIVQRGSRTRPQVSAHSAVVLWQPTRQRSSAE